MKLDQELALVEEALKAPRFYGDLVVAAFFAGSNDKLRKARLDELSHTLAAHLAKPDFLTLYPALESARRALRSGDKAIVPFHWEIEFPEVFDRENPGFEGFVGNPPFAGKNTMAAGHADGYPDWLKTVHNESHGNADLVAHFFRRAFDLLRGNGAFGLIATNTIGQGDTRSTGLRWICNHGGTIYAATRRKRWPGLAAVIVSVVHVGRVDGANSRPIETVRAANRELVGLTTSRTSFDPPYRLDDRDVPIITAYLFHAGGHDDPVGLGANEGKSIVGNYVLGMGFIFDDNDRSGVANPLSLMHDLISKNPRNAERIFPYIGGEEVNESPTHSHSRYIIDFDEMSEEEAKRWPDLFRLLEDRVKTARASVTQRDRRELWWLYATRSPSYRTYVSEHGRCLGISLVTSAFAFGFITGAPVVAHTVATFALSQYSEFAILQSRAHEAWARFFGSSLEDRLRYTPSDCFDPFPFPEGLLSSEGPVRSTNSSTHNRQLATGGTHLQTLESAGRVYYEFRAALMVKNNEGLTKTYNRFHDPDDRSPEIVELRELHAAMDRAVLDAYGWTGLEPTCEFLLDYEEDDDEDELATANSQLPTRRRRKKPWRYRWPDDFRDEVLARLLELNRQRAEEERLSRAAADGNSKNKTKRKSMRGKKARTESARDQSELPGFIDDLASQDPFDSDHRI